MSKARDRVRVIPVCNGESPLPLPHIFVTLYPQKSVASCTNHPHVSRHALGEYYVDKLTRRLSRIEAIVLFNQPRRHHEDNSNNLGKFQDYND
jgi:hypothetical protein